MIKTKSCEGKGKSRALATRLVDNDIRDGESGASSYLVDIPNGGSLIMQGNFPEKGPRTNNPGTAISIGAEGVINRTQELRITENRFVNGLPHETIFVRNLAETNAMLIGNRLSSKVTPLLGRRIVR